MAAHTLGFLPPPLPIDVVLADYTPGAVLTPAERRKVAALQHRASMACLANHHEKRDELDDAITAICEQAWRRLAGIGIYSVVEVKLLYTEIAMEIRRMWPEGSIRPGEYGSWCFLGDRLRADGTAGERPELVSFRQAFIRVRGLDGQWRAAEPVDAS